MQSIHVLPYYCSQWLHFYLVFVNKYSIKNTKSILCWHEFPKCCSAETGYENNWQRCVQDDLWKINTRHYSLLCWVFQESRACLGAVDSKPQRSPFLLSVPPSPPLSTSFQPLSPPALPFHSIPAILPSPPSRPSRAASHLLFHLCAHSQPGMSGCFLFHVKAIPTGSLPNKSFPPRYGEKITFRV